MLSTNNEPVYIKSRDVSENFGTTAYDYANLAKPGPMQDVRVRRAWAYAIDTQTLIDVRAPGATAANGQEKAVAAEEAARN